MDEQHQKLNQPTPIFNDLVNGNYDPSPFSTAKEPHSDAVKCDIPESPSPDQVTELIPGYTAQTILGRGGMGVVYFGIQANLKRAVAIKLLPLELGRSPGFAERFRREAQSMAQLNYQKIVQIYDFDQTADGHYYFIMEFVDGNDLHQYIQAGKMTLDCALNATSQICDALDFAHSKGVVHQDIKPANIFLTSEGFIKVGDFGLAKLATVYPDDLPPDQVSGGTEANMALGTPDYASPEQFAASPNIDRRTDIYSLGVMLYEMITGTPPRVTLKPLSETIRGIDPRIDVVIATAMATDPVDRYQSASQMKSAVDNIRYTPYSRPEKTNQPTNVRVSRGRKPSARKRKEVFPAILLIFLLITGVAAYFVWDRFQNQNSIVLKQQPDFTAKKTESLLKPFTVGLRKDWVTKKGEWSFRGIDSLTGSGNSAIELPVKLTPPYRIDFTMNVKKGMRPRFKVGNVKFGNEGYKRTLGLFPRNQVVGDQLSSTTYQKNQDNHLSLRFKFDHVSFYLNGKYIERINMPISTTSVIVFSGGDGWSKGEVEFSNLRITKNP